MSSFNLTREPWIPVERSDGTFDELSTRDALAQAHTLRGLADASPLVVAALTRHLLAILHRAYDGPKSMSEWQAIARAGAFDPARVDAYLDRVEDRMDLFHPTHPFAQTRGLVEKYSKYIFDIDELELTRSRWGLARALFSHRPAEHSPVMTPARAARSLLAHHAFVTGGWVKKPGEPDAASDGPLTRAAVVILRGATLFNTLVFNLLRYDPEEAKPFSTGGATDACAWEQEPPPRDNPYQREPRRPLRGYLDLLTWVSRRVELVHEGDKVTGFINAVWQGIESGAPQDPMVTWLPDETRGLRPVAIKVTRSFWRDANALFEQGRQGSSARRPHAIELVASVAARQVFGDLSVDVEVMGFDSNQSLIDAVRVERVGTRARCFDDAEAATVVENALARAADYVSDLRSALWTYARNALAPGGRDPDTAAVSSLVRSFGADAQAWSGLGVTFDGFLRALGDDPDAALAAFDDRARAVVREVFQSATARPDTAARWLKARALADRSLRIGLASRKKLLTPTKEERSNV